MKGFFEDGTFDGMSAVVTGGGTGLGCVETYLGITRIEPMIMICVLFCCAHIVEV